MEQEPRAQENSEYNGEEQYVGYEDVEEVVPEDEQNEQEPQDEENEMEEDNEEEEGVLEIDMSNNSWTYFDKHEDSVFIVFKHPKLPMVGSGGADNVVYLWTTHTQPPRYVGKIEGHKESVIAGSFSHDGKYLITGDMNGYIQVHKSTKGGEKWAKFGDLEQVDEVLWVEAHPRFPYFAFGGVDGSVWCYQIDESSQSLVQLMSGFSHTLECSGGVFVNVESDSEVTLVTISEDGTVISWNCFSGEVNYKLLPHDEFKGVESPFVSISAFKRLVAVGGRDGQLSIINNDTGKVIYLVKTIENVEEAELSIEAISWCKAPQIGLLAIGLVSGDVILFDTLQWRMRKLIKLEDAVTKLLFIEDTPFLVGSCMNGKIYAWDARSGSEIFAGVGHNMGILDFAILENGSKLVTAGDEGVSLVFCYPQ